MTYFLYGNLLARFAIALALWLPDTVARADAPPITIGVDAQPLANFDRVAAIANTLVRADSGPQKSDTLTDYLTLARIKKLHVIPQGDLADAQRVDLNQFKDVVTRIAHKDEPDLSRVGKWPQVYTAETAPNKNVIGWTNPDVLKDLYKSWKAKWPTYEITVNLNGKSLTNLYYTPQLANHAAYCAASDVQTFDGYPANNGYNLYQTVPYTYDKLMAVVGHPIGGYVECSDQALDGDENGGPFRGPTPNEQGTIVWSLLGHGAKEIVYFPQRIGKNGSPKFDYWAMKPANEQRAKDDFATINKYMALLATGVRTMTAQNPPVKVDYNKGTAQWPTTETIVWKLGSQSLTVTLDYAGGGPPAIEYDDGGGATPPEPAPPGPTPGEIALAKQLAETTAQLVQTRTDLDNAKSALTVTAQQLDAARADAATAKAALDQSEATRKTAASQAATLAETLKGPQPPPTTQPSALFVAPANLMPASVAPFGGANWGHGSTVAPGKVQADWSQTDLETYGAACESGTKKFQRKWPNGQDYNEPIEVFAQAPTFLDYENAVIDPATVVQHIKWFRAKAPHVPLSVIGYPYWDGTGNAEPFKPVHDLCDFVNGGGYMLAHEWLDRDLATLRADTTRMHALYPAKPMFFWTSPVMYRERTPDWVEGDTPDKHRAPVEMKPGDSAAVWALGREMTPGAKDRIVLYCDLAGAFDVTVRAFGSLAAVK